MNSTKLKATTKRANKPSPLLEAALDIVLVIVVGYGLILLSQSQHSFEPV